MLTERILLAQTTTGPMMATLPEAFARLCGGTLIGFDGLAAHQRHGWDFFLFQTAAMALARAGQATSAADDTAWQNLADADAWTGLLAALTPGCADTAWSLVVDDLRKPAFMQPPIPSASLARYAVAGTTPDEIDVLVTAKGHDVKPARAGAAEARHWLFALLILQTMQGYSGATNYGVARMNTGNGSRPLLMTTPSREMPTRFRRGVQAALAARASALDIHGGYYHGDGIPLLWLKPWETEDRLSLADLDPLFVEVCRRIRLVTDKNGNITAWGRGSEAMRTNAEGAKGNLGDAWTPTPGGAALTVSGGGFDYRLMTKLLALQRPERPAAMEPPPAHKGDMWLQATVLVRGQGKTEGLHERWLPIPAAAHGGFSDPETVGSLGGAMIADAGEARKALRLALAAYLQGGAEKLDFKDNRPRDWQDRHDREIDGIFFRHLFSRLAQAEQGEEHEAAAQAAWRGELVGLTRRLFDQAKDRLSPPDSRRERARAVASLMFSRLLNKSGLLPAQDRAPEETEE